MISQEKALQIAKDYAKQCGRGWDEHYHEAIPETLRGEPVWMVSTSDISYFNELPWMMKNMPNSAYYYISMIAAKCIAVGNRPDEFQQVGEG